MSVTNNPKKPVSQTNFLNMAIVTDIFFSSLLLDATEISLMALVPNPKFVNPAINAIVDVINPKIPIPDGPTRTAIALDLIICTIIFTNCTPPKMEVALNI